MDDAREALPEHLRRLNRADRWIALPLAETLEALEFFERHEDGWLPDYVEPSARGPSSESPEQLGWIIAVWGSRAGVHGADRIPESGPEAYAFVRSTVKGWARRWAARSTEEYLALAFPSATRDGLERAGLWDQVWSFVDSQHAMCKRLRERGLELHFDMDLSLYDESAGPRGEPMAFQLPSGSRRRREGSSGGSKRSRRSRRRRGFG